MTGSQTFSFAAFLDGAFLSLLWCAVGFLAWWAMFRAPLGRRAFKTSVLIKAPVEKIWSSYLLEPSPPGGWGGALEISRQEFLGEPPERHRALIRHGGTGPFRESVWRVSRLEPDALFEALQESMDGDKIDAADAVTQRFRFTPRGEAVLVEQETRRLARGVFGHLYVPRANRRCLEHLRAHCEGSDATHATPVVSRSASLALAAAAFLGIVALFSAWNPELAGIAAFVAAFLQIAIWLHEYGHLIAMRWFGQGQATLLMVPFLGGAAINARAPKTRFEDAVVALMGPAFSGAVVLALTPFVPWGLRFFESGAEPGAIAWSAPDAPATWAGLGAIAFLAMAIPINLYNLVPVGMLDGGRVVSALGTGRLSRALYAAAIFAVLAFAIAGSASERDLGAALAFVTVVCVIGLLTGEKKPDALAPMSRMERFATVAMLAVTLGIYVDASRSFMPAVMSAMRSGIDGSADAALAAPDAAANRIAQTASP